MKKTHNLRRKYHKNRGEKSSLVSLSNKPALGIGVYTPPDISLILEIPLHRIRWYINEVWDNRFGLRMFRERYSWDIDSHRAVNFLVLVEFKIVMELKTLGISTQKILKARNAIAEAYQEPYPFATSKLLAHPNRIWYKLGEDILNADQTHQYNFSSFVERYCRTIAFDSKDHLAKTLWPRGRDSSIIVDPRHQFGSPIIEHTNINAKTIYLMHKSGDSIQTLSTIYNLEEKNIVDAIKFYGDKRAA